MGWGFANPISPGSTILISPIRETIEIAMMSPLRSPPAPVSSDQSAGRLMNAIKQRTESYKPPIEVCTGQ
jgi:iron-sulfur cluster repair protein YtfE (RIC family)